MIHLRCSDVEAGIPKKFGATLEELGIQVSTGPVVDFRVKEHLRRAPNAKTAPLIYPGHFRHGRFSWPYGNPKKPSAIARNKHTDKLLFPSGNYTVVRRLSSKEEKRRIVASVVERKALDASTIGFENHLNVFHRNKTGLTKYLALGLMAYLSSSMLDAHFRAFNGHTQVNATDLRALPYPDADQLRRIGRWTTTKSDLSQDLIDRYLERIS